MIEQVTPSAKARGRPLRQSMADRPHVPKKDLTPEIPADFAATDLANPLASPVLDPALLKRFPPTLLITASRAMEMSAAINTHRELVKAGVEADLHVWDGLGHAFFYDIGLPESKEAFAVMSTFFRKHLQLK